MEFKVKPQEHYGSIVIAHPEADQLRREHCLCRHCQRLHDDEAKCARHILYATCRTFDVATFITRCPLFLLAKKDKF